MEFAEGYLSIYHREDSVRSPRLYPFIIVDVASQAGEI